MSSASCGLEYGEREAMLYDVFAATMKTEKGVRQSAEEALYSMSSEDPWIIVNLVNFAASPPEDVAAGDIGSLEGSLTHGICVRLAAAVRLRNVIDKEDWNKSNFFAADCRARVRRLLLDVLTLEHVHEKIQRQFVAVVQSIIEYDWPAQWPELIPTVLAHLAASRTTIVDAAAPIELLTGFKIMRAAVTILRYCCKKHEDPSKWGPRDTDAFSDDVIPLLVDVIEFCGGRYGDLLQEAVAQLPDVLDGYARGNGPRKADMMFSIAPLVTVVDEVTRFALKSCWSLTKNRIPAVLCTEGGIEKYLSTLASIWNQSRETYCSIFTAKLLAAAPVLRLSPRDISDEMQQSASWKKMKWLAHIVHHLLCEFILPNHCEARVRGAAKYFLSNYLGGFAELAFHALQWHHNPAAAPDVAVPAELQALVDAGDAPQKLSSKFFIMCLTILDVGTGDEQLYRGVIHPRSTELLTSLLFERLCFTPEDDELWRWNPEEYIRKQNDPTGDLFNAKKVSMSCTHQLVIPSMKFHDATLLTSYVQFMIGILESKLELLQRSGGFDNLNDTDFLAIDACLFSVSQLRKALSSVDVDSAMLEKIMMSLVLPLVDAPRGFIRARAVFVLARFSKIEWSDPSNYHAITQRVINATRDEELPVRIQTCSCLSKFIRHELARPVVEPIVAEVVQHYFSVMRQVDNDGVIRTLRRIIKFYSGTLSQWAVDLCQMIVDHFAVMKTDIEKRKDEIDREAEAAAEGVLHGAGSEMSTRRSGGVGGGGASVEEVKESGVHDTLAAADELLATMNTLVRSIPHTAGSRQVFSAIQKILAPMFHAVLGDVEHSLGFMDGSLQLLTDLVSHSDVVDEDIWSLVPVLANLAIHSATDYITQLVCPLDNFVSVDPSSFLSRSDAASGLYYVELFRDMGVHVLESGQLRVRDKASAAVLLDTVFLNVPLRVLDDETAGRVMATLLPVALGALQHNRATSTFKVIFANSVFAALHNHAAAAVDFMRGFGNCLVPFFARYAELVLTTEYLQLREYDRKVFLLGVIAMLELAVTSPDGPPPEVSECLISLLTSDLLAAMASQDHAEIGAKVRRLKKLLAKCAKKGLNPRHLIRPIGASNFKYIGDGSGDADDEDEFEDGESDSGSSTDTDSDDLGDLEDEDFDEDDDDEVDEGEGGGDDDAGDDGSGIESSAQYKQLLGRLGEARAQLHAENDDDDDEESENLLVDEEVATTIDASNAWSLLGNALMANLEHPVLVAVMSSDDGRRILGALHEDGGAAASLFDEREKLLAECKNAPHPTTHHHHHHSHQQSN